MARPYLLFEGKDIEQAVAKACQDLDIPRERLKYDIISHGSSGIFGLVGVKKAVIRVFTNQKDESPQKKSEVDERATKTVMAIVDEAIGPAPGNDADAAAQIPKELIDWVKHFLERISTLIADDADIETTCEKNHVLFTITSDHPACFIGKGGQTLDAIQFLVDKAVFKKYAQSYRVTVEIGGYRKKRNDKLRSLASRLHKKAKQMGKPRVIKGLSPYDRNVILDQLKRNSDIRVQVSGEGDYKNIVIIPKKSASRAKAKNKE